ncbi:hypothetical protein J5I95_13810 [Candidatus Poribacteria bacterium]|nr:hypothetical protein [Candidatus Poribacteria bacterium]
MAERFEYSIDCLIAREKELRQAYRELLNRPRQSDADSQDTQSQANRINRQIADIEDTLNNLYAIRECCPS